MQIKSVKVGMLETNCYIISGRDYCIIVDPGDDVEKILNELDGLKIDKIVLTHLHFDHIIAAKELKVKTEANIYCHKADVGVLGDNILQSGDIDGFLEETRKYKIQNVEFKIIHTPGHTPGSICLYFPKEKILFSGDTIFKGSVGATHFRGGKLLDLRKSVNEKLLILPGEVIVYPGHGEAFRLGDYKKEISAVLN